MESYLNSKAIALKQGGIRGFFDKAKNYSNVINLGIGEPDADTPKKIIDYAYNAMKEGKTHYTSNAGDIDVREAVANYVKNYGIDANPSNEIILTCGGMGAVAMAVLAIVSDDDEVIIQDPQWLNYCSQVKFAGGVPVQVPVKEEDKFVFKPKSLEKYINNKTKVLMINSPNNPTGAVMTPEDMEKIAQLAIKNDLFVISDEVYCELLYDGKKHTSIASLPGMKERTLVVNSLSKTFAMTGWRIGFAIGPKDIISKLIILQENLVACAPAPAQQAAKFALSTMCDVERMVNMYEKRRNIIVNGLNNINGIKCLKPSGAFYAFANIKELGKTSYEFAEELLEQEQVVVIPGSAFGPSGEGFIRVAYSNSEENLRIALERISNYVDSFNKDM